MASDMTYDVILLVLLCARREDKICNTKNTKNCGEYSTNFLHTTRRF